MVSTRRSAAAAAAATQAIITNETKSLAVEQPSRPALMTRKRAHSLVESEDDMDDPRAKNPKRVRLYIEESEDDTDSELELFPKSPKGIKHRRRARASEVHIPIYRAPTPPPYNPPPAPAAPLVARSLKRSERILDPKIAAHARLIAKATKAGDEIYDSDEDSLPGDVEGTNKPHLFRNVVWGSAASDFSNDADFPTEPDFMQFVPGRFEMLPDGTAADQKAKLLVKFNDQHGRKKIFKNPPPRDWTNQEAITALNKRIVQQIRRNTAIRFREVVQAYVLEERRWILANLHNGKPKNGWKKFVDAFNKQFAGRNLMGLEGVRPARSHSSLTKEVERFSADYSAGKIPSAGK